MKFEMECPSVGQTKHSLDQLFLSGDPPLRSLQLLPPPGQGLRNILVDGDGSAAWMHDWIWELGGLMHRGVLPLEPGPVISWHGLVPRAPADVDLGHQALVVIHLNHELLENMVGGVSAPVAPGYGLAVSDDVVVHRVAPLLVDQVPGGEQVHGHDLPGVLLC